MKIVIVTLFPELVAGFMAAGIPRIAQEKGVLQVEAINPRDFSTDRHRTVDDRPYGGGPGMVMKVQPLREALKQARSHVEGPVVYLTPQGDKFDQRKAETLASQPGLILLAGRYEGIDERLVDTEVDEELSIGDFVLSGGEVAAMAVVDSIARLLPGVLGAAASAEQDSFGADAVLDCPHYTRPEVLNGMHVPEVLLSGDHKRIARWRRQQSLERTWLRRPELLDSVAFRERATKEDLAFVDELIRRNDPEKRSGEMIRKTRSEN